MILIRKCKYAKKNPDNSVYFQSTVSGFPIFMIWLTLAILRHNLTTIAMLTVIHLPTSLPCRLDFGPWIWFHWFREFHLPRELDLIEMCRKQSLLFYDFYFLSKWIVWFLIKQPETVDICFQFEYWKTFFFSLLIQTQQCRMRNNFNC